MKPSSSQKKACIKPLCCSESSPRREMLHNMKFYNRPMPRLHQAIAWTLEHPLLPSQDSLDSPCPKIGVAAKLLCRAAAVWARHVPNLTYVFPIPSDRATARYGERESTSSTRPISMHINLLCRMSMWIYACMHVILKRESDHVWWSLYCASESK